MKNIIKLERRRKEKERKTALNEIKNERRKVKANRINYIQTMKNYNRISFSTYQLAKSFNSENAARYNE